MEAYAYVLTFGRSMLCAYPLLLMKDMLAHLAEGQVFTKLDLWEAYYRARLKAGDEWKTIFN